MSGDDSDSGGGNGDGSGGETGGSAEWPVDLRGVTESVVATLGPNELWNFAALGLHAPSEAGESVTATTWGNTRTRRNFHRQGGGVVQFTQDPREFVAAALTIHEREEPTLPEADAWVEVETEQVAAGEDGGTRWERWKLRPVESAVVRESVPTINRGFSAVVDATVACSRLDVAAFDTDVLLDRLDYFAETVEKCGGLWEVEAFETLSAETEWRSYREE